MYYSGIINTISMMYKMAKGETKKAKLIKWQVTDVTMDINLDLHIHRPIN
jgi:hypothetical protein